jgi:hypothetical protein
MKATQKNAAEMPMAAKLVLLSALLLTPAYFFGIRTAALSELKPILHLVGILVGSVGFVGLLFWNAVLAKTSLISVTTFLTIWMFVYLTLMLFFR